MNLIERLRDTPNWLRDPWDLSWQNTTRKYDRAPFEAADELERQAAKITDWERRSESCESKLGQLEANEALLIANARTKELEAEITRLVLAIGDHIAVRAEYYGRIKELETQLAAMTMDCNQWQTACEAKTEIMRSHTAERQDLQRQIVTAQSQIKVLREALEQWDALIKHSYSGTSEAMRDMQQAAFNTKAILDAPITSVEE